MSEDKWGALPPACLITQRHTGSHSALGILEQHYMRHYLTEDWRRDTDATGPPLWFSHCEPEKMPLVKRRVEEAEVLILTMRDPMEVAKSWIKRAMPLNQWFMDIWKNLFALQAEYDGLWLPVDTPDRDDYLKQISERIGISLQTDWARKGVTGNNHEWRDGMTLDEVRQFYKTLPFGQFGYGKEGKEEGHKEGCKSKAGF